MAQQKPITMAALGRPFYLGMLYDARTDKIITGATLWDPENLANNTNTRTQPYTGYEVITEDSLQKKAYALGVEASLKLSMHSGLISMSGSAKFAEDYQKTTHETRMTLKYSTTTHFEQLTMKHLGKGNLDHPDLHDLDLATHVVTGVLYGAEAFFVFDRTISAGESKKEISGTLHVMIKKIPGFQIDGKAKLNMSENEKYFVDKMNCKFYGDFRVSENPSTFEEAVRIYRQLPSLLGEKNENAVPKKVWLYPLNLLDNKAMRFVREISSKLVDYSISVIENLHSMEVKALDLSKSTLFTYFTYMNEHLSDFAARLSEFERDLKEKIALYLPKIRGSTGVEESVLFNVFKQIDVSPFNKNKLESWLREKQQEITLITTWIENLAKNVSSNIIIKSSSLDEVISDTRYEYIFCLSFRFVEENDPQLVDMHNYQYDKTKFNSSKSLLKRKTWFTDRHMMAKIRKNLRNFIEFVEGNKHENEKIKFIVDEGYAVNNVKSAELILYEDGLEKQGFIIPSKPDAPYSKSVTDNSIILRWTDKASGSEKVKNYKVLYRKYKNKTLSDNDENEKQEKWTEIYTKSNQKEIIIWNLPSKTSFEFKVQSVTAIGLSAISGLSEPIETLAKKGGKMTCYFLSLL
ncbi:unnamed protein product [Rotaria sp. Silwood1]|nr:unnamed protein product [Rotaria sp. Silwood1]CAF1582605.1 unnamed protein product [Rotaria sp. Silwood1]CAF3666518.1 unnamed protein product [Rotaria sp. Silwood1]CAF3679298.1 unnamed protein product [Rotaria sp. Silwood1]CAF3714594.1 unnamed protein product [Rotaria sp. Silwood1]